TASRSCRPRGPRNKECAAPGSSGANVARISRTLHPGHAFVTSCRGELLVLGLGALECRPRDEAVGIGGELWALGHELEHHAPPQRGADDHARGGELLTPKIPTPPPPPPPPPRRPPHQGVEIPVTQHAAPRLFLARVGAIHHRRLDAVRSEEQPL